MYIYNSLCLIGKNRHMRILTLIYTTIGVLKKTAEALKQCCIHFVNSVESDSEIKRSFLPSNAAVQSIVSGTVNAIRRVMPFIESYEQVFMDVPMPWDVNDGDSVAYDELSSGEDIRFPRFSRFVDHVFQKLIESLTRMHNPRLGGKNFHRYNV